MEFLYKLYSNDYFGIGLFIVITILAFSFLIILFFGKKDEKARNEKLALENNTNNEIENKTEISTTTEEIKTESLETMALPVEVPVTPVLEQVETTENIVKSEEISVDPFVSSNVVLNTDFIAQEPKVEPMENISINNTNPVNNVNVEPVKETSVEDIFNVSSLENSINNSFNMNMEPEQKQEFAPIIEEKKEEININPFNIEPPIIEEPVQNNIFSEPKEETPKRVMPTQFSSVYLTKEKEEPKTEVLEQVQPTEEIAPIPLKPDFDLPKPLDLPKLNKESGVSSTTNDNIIKPLTNDEANNGLNSIFGNIEEDSYTINK